MPRPLDRWADDWAMTERYEYKVLELREVILNEHAAQGWRLKAITSADVKGRVGRGGVERLLVMFDRVRG